MRSESFKKQFLPYQAACSPTLTLENE